MKIGIVLPGTPVYSETFFRSKINGLQAHGIEVVVFAAKKDPGFQLAPVVPAPALPRLLAIRVVRMVLGLVRLFLATPKASMNFYRLERKAGRGLRTALENLYLNSHILPHCLDWLHFGFATMVVRRENVAKAIGARMAISLRGYDIAIHPLKHPGCYNLLWERVDKVHTISDDLLALAYVQGMPKNTPAVKITPAIDVAKFQRTTPVAEAFGAPLRLLTVARLHWKKGLEYTLEALVMLQKAGIDFHYTLIGKGEEYERLVFAAHQLGIREQVDFTGIKSHAEVKTNMENADIYLQYSISEGFCNAVLEAQAMGLLCIVSNAEGLPENVLHGQTGWVVPKRKPELLAQQIVAILNMPNATLAEMRKNAVERVQREFNLDKQQREFVDFYS